MTMSFSAKPSPERLAVASFPLLPKLVTGVPTMEMAMALTHVLPHPATDEQFLILVVGEVCYVGGQDEVEIDGRVAVRVEVLPGGGGLVVDLQGDRGVARKEVRLEVTGEGLGGGGAYVVAELVDGILAYGGLRHADSIVGGYVVVVIGVRVGRFEVCVVSWEGYVVAPAVDFFLSG